MTDLKTTADERAFLRNSDLFERVCVNDYTGQMLECERSDEVCDILDDLDTLFAERESLRSTVKGLVACNEALLAENAKLLSVAEDGRELLRMVSMTYYDPPACGVVAGINIGEIREFLAATDPPDNDIAALEAL